MNPAEESQTPEPSPNKSHTLLGWNLVRQALSRSAMASITRTFCEQWEPTDDLETARHWLKETAEMVRLLESVEGFPVRRFDSLAPLLNSAKEQILVDPEDCLGLKNFLRLARDLQRYLKKQPEAPLLNQHAARLDPLPALLKELERCIDDDGEINENASLELKQAVRDAARARQSLETAAQKILAKSGDILQDSYSTEREGRLVVPVRSDSKSRLEGIVHDSSGSGQTLYIEPTSLIPLNNQLKICRLNIEKEKHRILSNLAREILTHREILQSDEELLVLLDFIHARASLAQRMRGRHIELNHTGNVTLHQARNPELILNGHDVVPNDIHWDEETQVIIISGPNTGGKTVTLKTVGLMSLMARAGLFLPVGENSELRFFPEVYADIGDEQSVQRQLSTFSGHLEKIVHILNHAPAGSLILLDELGIATDPQEGAALAESILVEMKRRGFMVLVSTHYLALKTLAQTQTGFLNACTEFDGETHRPTYRLMFGVPGHSAALETAERLGLDAATIARAREIYNEKDHRAESLLQDLNRQKSELEQEKASLKNKLAETELLRQRHKELTAKLQAEEKDYVKTKSKRIQTAVKEAQREIRKMIQELRHNRDLPKVRKVEKKIQSMGQLPLSALSNPPSGWDVPADKLKEGDAVLVEDYDAFGVLLEDPKAKSRVRVLLGNLPTVIETKKLSGNAKGELPKGMAKPKERVQIKAESQSHPQSTCDMRGMRVEEAQDFLQVFLSRAVLNKVQKVTLIHGHGTGKIKQMVRDYLQSAGIGKSFAPGERHEGGDGVTIVTL